MKSVEEIKTKLSELNLEIDYEIKNPPADDKLVSRWITNLGVLDGQRRALKWALEEKRYVFKIVTGKAPRKKTEVPLSKNAINAMIYLNKIKHEQD